MKASGKTEKATGKKAASFLPTGRAVTGASGLRFQTFNRRGGAEGQQTADAFLQTILGIDEALTALTGASLAGRTLSGISPDAGHSESGAFFGLRGFNGVDGSLEDSAEDFVEAWLDEVNDQLPKRVRAIVSGIDGTAEELVSAVESAISIDRLLDLDVVKRTDEVLEQLGQSSGTLLDVYGRLNEAVITANSELDGSAESLANLNSVLSQQKQTAAELAAAYRTVGLEIDAALGNTIQSIRESVMSDEEIFGARRERIGELTAQLQSAVDPERIRSIVAEVNQLSQSAFGLLDEGQQSALADGFIQTLTRVNEIAQQRLEAGLSDLAGRESGLAGSIDFELANEAAQTQMDAATTFAEAVQQFGQFASSFSGGRFSELGTL